MRNIILIDDKPEIPEKLEKAIINHDAAFTNTIKTWNPKNLAELKTLYFDNKGHPDKDSAADEDIWKRVLEKQKIDMVVVDHDLSGLDVRISESSITNACKQLGIPVCTYHRKPPNNDSQNLKDRVNQARSFSIEIEIDDGNEFKNAAREIINIYQGFKEISEKILKLDKEILYGGPAKIISVILDKPELEAIFARYTSSSTLAADIIQYNDEGIMDEEIEEILQKRIPFILGCWLYNYVLPFPGIILNNEAAASYINLDVEQFRNQYYSEFAKAQYTGPFSDSSNYWWRYDLDQIFFDENVEDATEYLANKGKKNVQPCKCSVNPEITAGYYCLVKKQPISFEESVGHLSWIPEGADLCRIQRKIYRRLAPMMGL